MEFTLAKGDINITIRGMTCNHCKANVETNLSKLAGIEKVKVDLDRDLVTLTGDNIDLDLVKNTVESIGYKFEDK